MKKKVCIVHYNTPEVTNAVIRSLWKHTPGCEVVVFDNSDERPFVPMKGVTVIDNTKGQICDFDKWIASYPMARPTVCNNGSEKHMWSVEYLFQHSDDGFVLLDSDALVRKDISDFFDESCAWIGQTEDRPKKWNHVRRVMPYCLWINVPMCKKNGIHFMSEGRIFMVSHKGPPWYDTGGSFYHDCMKAELPHKEVNLKEYIEHFVGGSQARLKKAWKPWLDKFKYLYEEEVMEKKPKVEKNKVEKYLVVIPYFAGGAQGRELEYAVTGWRRHFKEPYQIVVVGDYHPVVDTGDDITFIECERVPEQPENNYRPHIDFVKKFKAVHAAFPKSKGFIFVADDVYAVNNFDIYDIMVLKQNGHKLVVDPNKHSGFERDKRKTIEALSKEGLPIRNFTTHLPTWFEWDKLEKLWEKYDMENNSYIIEDLYFNTYYADRLPLPLHIDYDNMKCGVYRRNPRISYIEKAFRNKIWIQNSVEGWIPELVDMLANYYDIH